jgi:hypothetical protein
MTATASPESFESIWGYCTANNRAIPKDWQRPYEVLIGKKQKATGGWDPPLPLILAAWYVTMPIEKQLRFKEHVQWAADHNQAAGVGAYLRSLPEEQWYHFGEL